MKTDPTYGYDLSRLRQVDAPGGPADFAEFWQQQYAQTRALALDGQLEEIDSPHPATRLYEMSYGTLGGLRIGGWITQPREAAARIGKVVSHGYGGREGPEFDLPGPPAVTIFPCARGFDRSTHADFSGDSQKHVITGIAHRETYVHLGCVAEIWGAVSVLSEAFPEISGTIFYVGGSFGGGIGALALPWEPRISRAFLDVPSFGNHPLRVGLRCLGSGRAVRQRYLRDPRVLDVLAYFDAATAARHITIPVLVAAALADSAVPPPGQFAVYNALAGPKELVVRQTGHPTTPADDRAVQTAVARWFAL